MQIKNIHLVFDLEEGSKTVEPTLAASYRGDFYGLLRYLQVDEYMYPYVFKINNITSSTDFDGKISTLRLVSPTILDR